MDSDCSIVLTERDAGEAAGPAVARHLLERQALRLPDWTHLLHVDAHTAWEQGWDATLVDAWAEAVESWRGGQRSENKAETGPNPRVVLTYHPPAFSGRGSYVVER